MKEGFVVTADNRLTLCDLLAEKTVQFCEKYIKDKKEILRYRLTLEECLLNWLTEEAIGKELTINCYKKMLRKPCIELTFSGVPNNPYVSPGGKLLGTYGGSVLRTLGLSPVFSYQDNENVLRFELNAQKRSTLQQLAMVIGASILVGLLGLLLPDAWMTVLRDEVIAPIYDTFFDVLGCVAGPMIFLSVAWGVYGIGDAATLSKVGKRMLLTFVALDFLVCGLGAMMTPLFRLSFNATGGGGMNLSDILNMILDVVPSTIIEPFADGNTLQIIFLGVSVGVALLFLGKRTESVARAIEQINYVVQYFMEFISKLVPYVVFLVIVSLFWSGTVEMLLTSWKLLVVLSLFIVLTCLGYYAYTAMHLQVKMSKLMKKCLPSLLVAFATASSAATFSTNIEICKKKLGISDAISSFGVPLAMVLHNPIAALNNLAVALFFASYYGVECSPAWLVTAVFLSAMLAVATPPIPGGGTLAYTLLLTQLGIPEEALAVALAVDMLSDFIITAAEMFCLLPALTNVAAKIGMLNKDILRKES